MHVALFRLSAIGTDLTLSSIIKNEHSCIVFTTAL